MPIASDKPALSTAELLQAVAKLPWKEFHEFMSHAATVQPTPPEAPRLSRRETALLLKINQGPPQEWQPVYCRLIEKRRTGRISVAEEKELIRLADRMERYDVARMKWLTELAALRKLPLRSVIKSLGLKTPEYV